MLLKTILLLLWMILTLILVFSLIGFALLISSNNYQKTTWMEIGTSLVDSIIEP